MNLGLKKLNAHSLTIYNNNNNNGNNNNKPNLIVIFNSYTKSNLMNGNSVFLGFFLRFPSEFIRSVSLRLLPTPVGLLVLPCTCVCRRPPHALPFFFLSRTEDTSARDRRALQQLALNVHAKLPELT